MAKYKKKFYPKKDTYIDTKPSYKGDPAPNGGTNSNFSHRDYMLTGWQEIDDWNYNFATAIFELPDISEVRWKKITDAVYWYYRISGNDRHHFVVYPIKKTPAWSIETITARNMPLDYASSKIETTNRLELNTEWYGVPLVYTLQYMFENDDLSNWQGLGFTTHKQWGGNQLTRFHAHNTSEIEYIPYIEITYEDSPPLKPEVLTPQGAYVNNADVVRFTWKYNSEIIKDTQVGFELEWALQSQKTWTKVTKATSDNFYDMPANTMPTGKMKWRIRTKNRFGELSPYSDELYFNTMGMPAQPTVTVTNIGNRPAINWTAVEQQVFQVQILQGDNIVYDSGVIPAITMRTHRLNGFLPNGEYIAKARIKNEFDLFSKWGETTFSIETEQPPTPSITVGTIDEGIQIRVQSEFNGSMLIYRAEIDKNESFKLVGKSQNGMFIDYTVKGGRQYKYKARLVLNDVYSDSEEVVTYVYFKYATISEASKPANYLLLKSGYNEKINKEYALNDDRKFQHFTGRRLPVMDIGEFEDNLYTIDYYLKKEDYYKFINIYNNKGVLLLRDNNRSIYGQFSNGIKIVNMDIGGYRVTGDFLEVDWEEEVTID